MSFAPQFAIFTWVAWLLSSTLLWVFAYRSKLNYIMSLQVAFFLVNVSGIYNTWGTL